ncbi:prepilin signal peptidase PulO-like enzyme (type II secretory pathway) [Clostridiales Family XIII bacterium PM5-7]
MTDTLLTIIKCLSAIFVGILQGNGAVYFFNKMPPMWLTDYGEEPLPELLDVYTQRVKSNPWKYVFTMAFVAINIKLVMENWRFAMAATCAIWLLLEMAIADKRYRIVPDQLVVLLAVTAFGLIPFHGGWTNMALGGALGFGIMGFVALLGKLVYRRDTLGGGDIKLFAALGLVMGTEGILVTFILTTLFSAGHFVFLLARKKIKRTDALPMVPYIAVAATLFLVFLWGNSVLLYF